ncbi:hypothetical protein HUG17_5948 [Dermatophagoides farinae]|uniref:Uncharacterized protein n=1 Tax=Dermatophagoides farinae TaxID=6954 RepID=A0A9D4P2K4_DERFA|nr:hypothetical protein HUG17_5948 [Dermatophagoides farinae]
MNNQYDNLCVGEGGEDKVGGGGGGGGSSGGALGWRSHHHYDDVDDNNSNGSTRNSNNMIRDQRNSSKTKNYPYFTIILRQKLPIQLITNGSNNDETNNKMKQRKRCKNQQNLLNDFEFTTAWQIWLLNDVNENSFGDWNVKRFGMATKMARTFWSTYSQLQQRLSSTNDDNNLLSTVMIFRDSIEPKWEDQCNAGGGRCKNYWTECLQLIMSGSLGDYDWNIVGMILNLKPTKYRISLWIRSSTNFDQIIELGKQLRKRLNLQCQIKFELHTENDVVNSNSGSSSAASITARFNNSGGGCSSSTNDAQ